MEKQQKKMKQKLVLPKKKINKIDRSIKTDKDKDRRHKSSRSGMKQNITTDHAAIKRILQKYYKVILHS